MSATDNGWVQQYDCSRVNAWMSVTEWFQQSESFGMSAVAVCHVHTAWSNKNVKSWMSLWRTWEFYERFIFFVSAKENRSKSMYSCWGCSCFAIVDASAAGHSVLFVSSVRPVYSVAAVWVSFKFVFVFQDSCVCCQSASSVCVCLHQQWPGHWEVQQVQVVSQKNANSCVFTYWTATRILHWYTTDILI